MAACSMQSSPHQLDGHAAGCGHPCRLAPSPPDSCQDDAVPPLPVHGDVRSGGLSGQPCHGEKGG